MAYTKYLPVLAIILLTRSQNDLGGVGIAANQGERFLRNGPKIFSVTRDWTQIIRVTGDQTLQPDAWFAICERVTRNVHVLLIRFPL